MLFAHDIAARFQPGDRPLVLVFDSLTSRLTRVPQLKILGAVIKALPVLVVDYLIFGERSAKHMLHDVPMLGDVSRPPVGTANANFPIPPVGDVSTSIWMRGVRSTRTTETAVPALTLSVAGRKKWLLAVLARYLDRCSFFAREIMTSARAMFTSALCGRFHSKLCTASLAVLHDAGRAVGAAGARAVARARRSVERLLADSTNEFSFRKQMFNSHDRSICIAVW
jgi:hypothetical protein